MVKYLFIDAKYKGNVELDKQTLDYCKKFKVITLYSSVQFNLAKIISQLKELKIKIISSKPSRAGSEYQILGCNVYPDSLNLREEPEAFLYVGDGMFHPLALVFANRKKEIIHFNPISKRYNVLTEKYIEKVLNKQKANLAKFFHSKTIGILISAKPGQEHLNLAKDLEKKYKEKEFYYFLDNNISFDNLENFPFIESWINTACPRIALDELLTTEAKIINISEIL